MKTYICLYHFLFVIFCFGVVTSSGNIKFTCMLYHALSKYSVTLETEVNGHTYNVNTYKSPDRYSYNLLRRCHVIGNEAIEMLFLFTILVFGYIQLYWLPLCRVSVLHY